MANKLKSETSEGVKEKKERSKKSKITFRDRIAAFRAFVQDERTHKVAGLLIIMISFFMIVSFISNLFTWKTDQAIAGADTFWQLMFRSDVDIENWLGKIGAVTGLRFQNEWFGVCAFIFPFILFLYGVRILWDVTLLPFGKTLRYSLFIMIWLSTFLGYIFHNSSSLLILAGGYGYRMSQTLNSFVGFIGTGTLLVFSLTGFFVVAFNIPLKMKKEMQEGSITEDENLNPVIPDTKENSVKENIPNTVELELGVDKNDDENEDGEFINLDEEEIVETLEEKNTEDGELEIEPLKPALVSADGEVPMEVEAIVNEVLISDGAEELIHAQGDYDPTLDLSSYKYPTLDLLENYGDKKIEVNKDELEANKNRIVETLSHYNILIEKIKATIGPTVTLFEIVPQAGVRISKIKNLEDDIALSLAALGIRIIAPIPGKGTIGIEVPNQKPEVVPMKSVLGSEKFVNNDFELPIGLGKTISAGLIASE